MGEPDQWTVDQGRPGNQDQWTVDQGETLWANQDQWTADQVVLIHYLGQVNLLLQVDQMDSSGADMDGDGMAPPPPPEGDMAGPPPDDMGEMHSHGRCWSSPWTRR